MFQARRRLAFLRGLSGATVFGLCVSLGFSLSVFSGLPACGDPPLYQRADPDAAVGPDGATGGSAAATGGRAGAAGGAGAAGAGGLSSNGGRAGAGAGGSSAGGTSSGGSLATGGSSTAGATGEAGSSGGQGGTQTGGVPATGGATGGRGGPGGSEGGAATGGGGGAGGLGGNGGSVGGRAGNGGGAGTGGSAGAGGAGGGSLPSGALLHYTFDETSGTVIHDDSGASQDGTTVGATFVAGRFGNSVLFRGNGDYAVLPAVTSALTDMTVAFWVNLAASNTWQRIIELANAPGMGSWYVTPNATQAAGSTGLRFYISKTDYTNAQVLDGPSLTPNTWKHVAVTLASAATTIYVDGVAVASTSTITLRPKDLGKTTSNWLGRSQIASDPYFGGQIDDLYIFGRALSAAEIQRLMAGP